MKKLTITALIVSAVFTACKKEDPQNPQQPRRCYECETIKSTESSSGAASSAITTYKTYCDQTALGILEIEKAGTYSRFETVYFEVVRVQSKTKCK